MQRNQLTDVSCASEGERERRWDLVEASDFLRLRLDQGYEMQVTLHAIRPLDDAQWQAMDRQLRQPRRHGMHAPRASDAELLLWLRGVVDRREEIGVSRMRALSDTLSVGLRTNAFEALIDMCERIGLGTRSESRFVAEIPTSALIDLQLKYVRLLKRRGSFSRALDALAIAASEWAIGDLSEQADLIAANLLYGVAKAVGSHQNRVDQSSRLCGFGEERIRNRLRSLKVSWRVFLSGRHDERELRDVEKVWRKLVDYRIKQQFLQADERTRLSLLRQWDLAVEFELRHGIETGRARFARLLALAKTATNEDARESHLTEFEFLLARMSAKESPDLRGMAIRHLQAAEIYLAAKAIPRASQLLDIALRNAERSSDWASVARTQLLRSDLLLQDSSPDGRGRWEEALIAVQRANDAVKRHVEPPLPLLLSSCSRQARIALAIGDFGKAKEHIHDALEHVAAIRIALVQEDWTCQRKGSPPGWLAPVGKLLTTRERALLQACVITDWDALVTTQNDLVRHLEQASLLETNARIVSVSSERVDIIRSSIAHDAANILNTGLSRLIADHGQRLGDAEIVHRRDILAVQRTIDDAIRKHVGRFRMRGEAGSAIGVTHGWHSAADLCLVEEDDLELLRMFAPHLAGIPVDVLGDFCLRCDPDLFRVMLMQFLLNSAQEVGVAASGTIQIRVSYSRSTACGRIEVRDSAGCVQQLASAIDDLSEGRSEPASGRGWGLRHALEFFRETWGCKEHVGGESGVYTILALVFQPGNRLQPPHP